MTHKTNARIAGFTFLFYIAVGIPAFVLLAQAMRGDGIRAKLISTAQNATTVRVVILLSLLMCFSALVLGVTLYAMTRDQDRDLALLGLVCRAGEGIAGAVFLVPILGQLWLATTNDSSVSGGVGGYALGEFFLRVQVWSPLICATLFAVGSTLFSWLFLRGQIIPIYLAWIGVFASVILVIGLPLRLAGLLQDPLAMIMWLPMLVFEVPLGVWLLVKGGRFQASQS